MRAGTHSLNTLNTHNLPMLSVGRQQGDPACTELTVSVLLVMIWLWLCTS